MTIEPMEEKTAVFQLGSLPSHAEPRSYDLDEPTRELPLISGRFAGREWIVEDLQREYTEKKAEKALRPRKTRRALGLSLGAAAAAILLICSLLGQAKLVDLNEKTTAAETQIAELQAERSEQQARGAVLRVENRSGQAAAAESADAGETGDRATVLSIRRGREMNYLWNSFLDSVGASFR